MIFSFRNFIRCGLLDAVGRQADYWVILNAAGWMEKGVLTEDDLAEIQAAIDARNQSAPATPENTGGGGEGGSTGGGSD